MSIVVLFTPQFVSTIGTPTEIVSLTSNYLLLKAIALPFDSVAILLLIAIKVDAQRQETYSTSCSSQCILNIILDLFLISNTSVSLNMGVQGAAIGYVISKVALFIVTAAFAIRILGIKLQVNLLLTKWNSTARSSVRNRRLDRT